MESDRLKAFRTGESWALERVYREHVDLVRSSVHAGLRRAGRLSSWTLSDIVQETFTKAFAASARERYDGKRCYAPYLLAIARNCLVDWLRHARRELPTGNDLDPLSQLAHDRERESEFAPELAAVANRCVVGLSGELRAVHWRRFELGESQARAAEELRISRQTLRTLEHRLIVALRWELRSAGWSVPARPRKGQVNRHLRQFPDG
jgi:RNA polymerase sigma factor (sigma-70 family)